jgi:hypothetical protein
MAKAVQCSNYSWAKKRYTKILGKPNDDIPRSQVYWEWAFEDKLIRVSIQYVRHTWRLYVTYVQENEQIYQRIDYERFYWYDLDPDSDWFQEKLVFKYIFEYLHCATMNEQYENLQQMSENGDYELAVLLAKSNNLL